jgi:hypothetical protein
MNLIAVSLYTNDIETLHDFFDTCQITANLVVQEKQVVTYSEMVELKIYDQFVQLFVKVAILQETLFGNPTAAK